MNKKEAIHQLQSILDAANMDDCNAKEIDALDEEAINMAIKALKQEPCGDTISRQAVLDYIYNDLGLGDEENGKDVERQMELESSYRYVKSLPPVTPKKMEGKT